MSDDEMAKRVTATERNRHFPQQHSYSARDNLHTIPLPVDNGRIRFGGVGDMHLNSRLCNEKGIEKYFHIAQDMGTSNLFSPGDQIDGLFIYPEQHLHLQRTSITEQVEYAAQFLDYVLHEGSRIFVINGNHELGGRRGVYQCYGIDPCDMLERRLPAKITYLHNELGGNMYASARVNPNLTVDMVHTKKYVGNQPGSTTETLLKGMILGYTPEDRPELLLVNHTHRHGHTDWQGCHAYLCGGFENPNNYSSRQNQGAEQGSYVFTVFVDEKPISISQRWISVKRGI